jgi:hypothetical protein
MALIALEINGCKVMTNHANHLPEEVEEYVEWAERCGVEGTISDGQSNFIFTNEEDANMFWLSFAGASDGSLWIIMTTTIDYSGVSSIIDQEDSLQ